MTAITPSNPLNSEPKGNYFHRQLLQAKEAFFEQPCTMRMVEVYTGILRPNICRYVATLKDSGLIQLYKVGRCPYTNHRAGFYTTNPALFSKPQQLSLFEQN